MIYIYSWNRTTRSIQALDPEALEAHPERLRSEQEVIWIDLSCPTEEEEQRILRRIFPVHALSLEDATHPRRHPGEMPHFPKVEEFPDYLFAIVNPLTREFREKFPGSEDDVAPEGPPVTQLSAILTRTTLITHHGVPLECIDTVKAYLGRHRNQVDRGPDYIFHLLLDETVDEFVPILDRVDDLLEDMEMEVVQRPKRRVFRRLMHLKRHIIQLRKTLIYEREILVRLSRGEFDLVDERETVYYRNVFDHLVRFTELIESSRDLASDLLQSWLAANSNRLNEIMKVLTMISTTILPMTLIAGIYGMNFEKLPELKWDLGYPFALGLMFLTGAVTMLLFRWRKWF